MSINSLIDNPNILNQLVNLLPANTSPSIIYSSTQALTNQSSSSPIQIASFPLDLTTNKTLYFLVNASCNVIASGYGSFNVVLGGTATLTYSIPLNTTPSSNTAFFVYTPLVDSSSSCQINLIPPSGGTVATSTSDIVSVIIFQQPA